MFAARGISSEAFAPEVNHTPHQSQAVCVIERILDEAIRANAGLDEHCRFVGPWMAYSGRSSADTAGSFGSHDYEPSTSKSAPDTAVVLSAAAIAALIVQQSRTAYYATGHPCACPDDLTRSGKKCGASSAYSRPGGASPKCYPSDVNERDIEDARAQLK
jgi:hypothetical protein